MFLKHMNTVNDIFHELNATFTAQTIDMNMYMNENNDQVRGKFFIVSALIFPPVLFKHAVCLQQNTENTWPI